MKLILVLLVSYFTSSISAQFIKDTYRFNNTLSVSAPDCGSALEPAVAGGFCSPVFSSGGAFISDTLPHCGIRRDVYHNNLNWGLKYPNTAGAITTTYTIHIYLKNTNWGNLTWVRIIDFSAGPNDEGIYFKKETASSDRCFDFWPNGIVGPCPYFNDTTWYLLTFTRNGATNMMSIYVNNILFALYNDAAGLYTSVPGKPVYIYRDDDDIPCESGEASFAYLSFTNQFSGQGTVDSVYNDICSIASAPVSANFTFTPNSVCQSQNVMVSYMGDIPYPGTGYSFNWNWDGAKIISGSGMGPFIVNWTTNGVHTVTLTVINDTCGGQNSSTKQITINQFLYATMNMTICEGQSFLGYSATGIYIDTLAASNQCDSIRTLILTVTKDAKPDLGPDKEICIGDSLTLSPGKFLSYLWQDGSTMENFVVKEAGFYFVTITLNCGSASDNIIITEKNCIPYFPNAFTPNLDGINDLFRVLNSVNLQEYKMIIYDRWGQKIFQTNNPLSGWDGTVKGKLQNTGVYVWYAVFKRNNQQLKLKGTVLLIR